MRSVKLRLSVARFVLTERKINFSINWSLQDVSPSDWKDEIQYETEIKGCEISSGTKRMSPTGWSSRCGAMLFLEVSSTPSHVCEYKNRILCLYLNGLLSPTVLESEYGNRISRQGSIENEIFDSRNAREKKMKAAKIIKNEVELNERSKEES